MRLSRSVRLAAGLGFAAVILAGCGSSGSSTDTQSVGAQGTPTGRPGPSTPPTHNLPAHSPDTHASCATISPDPTAAGQPEVPQVTGPIPTHLETKDVKVGTGTPAKAGDNLSVTYIGISCSNGQVFDATYRDGGQPFTVENLGQAQVIQGWNEGLVGVKPGGIRELIIPPDLGYGAQGAPPAIGPNETLIFLVTVKKITSS